ncbi:hypothetical protein [Nocardia seriolae]|uniref:ABC transporter substrate-binding protein n=1 Tax=Nocardia seriolae TaxID=37332 RepID=A0A0B8N1J6_9NOCA|nr:hypothetical protein [Nocardia seriolae]APB01197.1 hypothetical protein NS506_07172 [Nocardia seriolae]MTJ61301.1 hypothetical protein [Nocardia seriolae]MTJ71713.1 hypothetical protein [Nocardia seriolae]MTJ90575.1 hypothetical protein [Nocardia seriolae]MTK34536.1 hypothetical protein [Nocardia seriolae]
MKKLGTFALIGAAATGLLTAGAGLAAADDQIDAKPVLAVGEPDPTGTGSTQIVKSLTDLISTGSAKAGTTK